MEKEVKNQPVVIKNPSEKIKAFIKKMEEDKLNRRQELLKAEFNLTVQQHYQV